MDQIRQYYESFKDNYADIEQWKKIERIIKPNSNLYSSDPVFRLLFEKMRYVKYDTMINSIKSQISKLNPHTPFILFFPMSYPFKIGSENMIILECFPELSKLNIVDVVTEPSSNNISNLLIIDDCIYTGNNIKHIIESFPSVDNFVVITFASNLITECSIIDDYSEQCTIAFYNDHKYETLIDSSIKWVSDLPINNEIKKQIIANLKNIIGDSEPAFYFDHKIHPSLSQILDPSLFAEGHVPNRLPITHVEKILDVQT